MPHKRQEYYIIYVAVAHSKADIHVTVNGIVINSHVIGNLLCGSDDECAVCLLERVVFLPVCEYAISM